MKRVILSLPLLAAVMLFSLPSEARHGSTFPWHLRAQIGLDAGSYGPSWNYAVSARTEFPRDFAFESILLLASAIDGRSQRVIAAGLLEIPVASDWRLRVGPTLTLLYYLEPKDRSTLAAVVSTWPTNNLGARVEPLFRLTDTFAVNVSVQADVWRHRPAVPGYVPSHSWFELNVQVGLNVEGTY